MEDMGKWLIVLGIAIAILGCALLLAAKVPGLERLPGDIVIQRDNFSCVFPLATSIVLSLVLTILVQLARWLANR